MLGTIIVVWDRDQGENADYDKHTVHVPWAALPWVNIALAEKFGLPVHAVGVGEGAEDMRPFEAKAFARSLMGLS